MSKKYRNTENRKENMSQDDVITTSKIAWIGDLQARDTLVMEHLWLVDQICYQYGGQGALYEDLYQAGCEGLIRAVEKFDPNKKISMSTYASFYIEKYLFLALAENYWQPIMYKYKFRSKRRKLHAKSEEFRTRTGRYPSAQELSACLGYSYREIVSIINSTLPAVYYDDPKVLESSLSCASEADAETILIENENEMCLDQFPVKLSARERIVLELRFGFGKEGKVHTFIEIGEIMGLSDDTASKICRKAIEKLKKSIKCTKHPFSI